MSDARVFAMNDRWRRVEIGGRYVDVPPGFCPNPRHPQGRFHPETDVRPWSLVGLMRRLRWGCSCEVAVDGPAEWAVFGNVNWSKPAERRQMTGISSLREAGANWVLCKETRGHHDVKVERIP